MRYENVCIESLAIALPEERWTSAHLEERLRPLYERLKLPEGRLELMSGIRERRMWPAGMRPSDASAAAGKAANPAGTAAAQSDLRKSLRRTLASSRSRISRPVSVCIRISPARSRAARSPKSTERQRLVVWELNDYSTAKSRKDSTYFGAWVFWGALDFNRTRRKAPDQT